MKFLVAFSCSLAVACARSNTFGPLEHSPNFFPEIAPYSRYASPLISPVLKSPYQPLHSSNIAWNYPDNRAESNNQVFASPFPMSNFEHSQPKSRVRRQVVVSHQLPFVHNAYVSAPVGTSYAAPLGTSYAAPYSAPITTSYAAPVATSYSPSAISTSYTAPAVTTSVAAAPLTTSVATPYYGVNTVVNAPGHAYAYHIY